MVTYFVFSGFMVRPLVRFLLQSMKVGGLLPHVCRWFFATSMRKSSALSFFEKKPKRSVYAGQFCEVARPASYFSSFFFLSYREIVGP
jgi:hypothetical protein